MDRTGSRSWDGRLGDGSTLARWGVRAWLVLGVVLATGAESADLGALKVDARVSKPFVPKTLLNAVAALIG